MKKGRDGRGRRKWCSRSCRGSRSQGGCSRGGRGTGAIQRRRQTTPGSRADMLLDCNQLRLEAANRVRKILIDPNQLEIQGSCSLRDWRWGERKVRRSGRAEEQKTGRTSSPSKERKTLLNASFQLLWAVLMLGGQPKVLAARRRRSSLNKTLLTRMPGSPRRRPGRFMGVNSSTPVRRCHRRSSSPSESETCKL